MKEFLQATDIIDWEDPDILSLASELTCLSGARFGTARNCFSFVRDEIRHSGDFQLNPVTCRASDVLRAGTGFCFGKSHLLAALLRANGIPAGLCYQRLLVDQARGQFGLHGLNALFLDAYGWFRVDPRGNKRGVTAEFIPPQESLAFTPSAQGERDLLDIYAEPLPQVIETLQRCETFETVLEQLPDV